MPRKPAPIAPVPRACSGTVVQAQIEDFVSGQLVRATPEETDAVQVFSRRLVEDYGYPKSHLATRPQHRVRSRPSDDSKSYPVDIAVFSKPQHTEDSLYMIVECKEKTRKEGAHQLRLYLDMSAAELGVWFNGQAHEYLRKVYHRDGTRTYEILPNIPRFGERIDDIGLYRRRDLRKPSNLKAVFRDLRNHLAGMTTGITRDEALAQEIINVLFCKILDEQETAPDDTVTFRAGVGDEPGLVRSRILDLFERVKVATFDDVFSSQDTINLDPDSLRYVVGELQNYSIMDSDRDAIGEAFEVFIGPALRGAEGQFFTPRNVVHMIVDMLDPQPGEKILDPACGSGGFLTVALEHVWQKLRADGRRKSWSAKQLFKREVEVASECFRGVDKDAFLSKVCKAYMALIGDGRGGVFCANSLADPSEWEPVLRSKIPLGRFDVVMTNPPFGVKIPIKGQSTLSQYELGHAWEGDTSSGFTPTTRVKESESPQILFIERCIQFLRPGGRLGIILPEGVLGNKNAGYILDFLRGQGRIVALVDCTRTLFQPHTDTKTDVVIFQKHGESHAEGPTFLSVAKTCGHDKRGRPLLRPDGSADDEIALVGPIYHQRMAAPTSRLGFSVESFKSSPYYLVPRYYSPETSEALAEFARNTKADLVSISDLVRDRRIKISKGHEIGSDSYGTGAIPFIRTSDIANLEITSDPTFGVSEEIYAKYSGRQGLRPHDILFVNDGRYRIGNVCLLSEHDTRIVIQSHFRVIRSLAPAELDPFLLLFLFGHPVVRLQVESKTFIQSTIATIGPRLREIVLPIPRDMSTMQPVLDRLRHIISERARLRAEAWNLTRESGVEL
jgi:type I restriction enzyme M protein